MYSILAQFWRNLCLVFRRRFATGCEIDVKLILSLKIFLKTSAFIFYWRLMYAVHLSWKISHRLKKENKFNGEIWRLLPEILMVMLLHFYKFHLAEEVCWKPVVSIILCFLQHHHHHHCKHVPRLWSPWKSLPQSRPNYGMVWTIRSECSSHFSKADDYTCH